jgi:ParB family transcriptional regulator, chromosome partitioning protein
MMGPHTRRALGRGLTNLIPVDTAEKGSGNEVVFVDVNAITSNPYQPRQDFDKDEIGNLAQSIKNQGLLQPILLRKKDSSYEIISGERRFRAMKLLGNDKVPCIVKPNISDHEMIEMALVENIQRENLNDIEQAYAYQRLMMDCGLSHEEISKKVGKSRSTITNFLRLLKLPEEIQQKVRQKELTMGHARALLAVEDPKRQKDLAQRILTESLTVRDIEKTSQPDVPGKKKNPKKEDSLEKPDPDIENQTEQLRYRFGTRVNVLKTSDGKGKIEIHFLSMDDLNRIIEILLLNN